MLFLTSLKLPIHIHVVRAYSQLSTKLHFASLNIMARRSQPKHQGPVSAGGHYLTQQASMTGSHRLNAPAKAKAIEELVAPISSFPFTGTYPSELKASDFEDMLSTFQNISQDQNFLNHEDQFQYSYATIARSWDQQSQNHQGKYNSQNRIPLAVWANQAPFEEPFNNIREVAFKSAGLRHGEGHDGEMRRGKRQKRGGF